MELVKFLDYKKQLQKLYNFKAKEEREILYSCKLKKDPLGQLKNHMNQLKIKKNPSGIMFQGRDSINSSVNTSHNLKAQQEDESYLGSELIALTKSRSYYFLEILYVNGDNITFPYSSNLNLILNVNVKIDEIINQNTSNDNINANNKTESNKNLIQPNSFVKGQSFNDNRLRGAADNRSNNNISNFSNTYNGNKFGNESTNALSSAKSASGIINFDNTSNSNNSNINLTKDKSNFSKNEGKEKSEMSHKNNDSYLINNDNFKNLVSIKFSDKALDLEFFDSVYLRELLWCLIKLIDCFVSSANIQTKGFNYKDLEDFAEKKNFYMFNKLFEIEKKKEKYDIDVSNEELATLKHTLNSININSILDYDLENLNTKIEQFNIKTKEDFLQSLQGSFGKGVAEVKEGQLNLERQLKEITSSLVVDSEMIEHVWNSIQKIEEANHRIELRWENKRKLEEYMKNLFDQLVIPAAKERSLLKCSYISNSDILIVSEILDKFLKFFRSRKKQDVKLAILSEGRQKIKNLVDSMIMNYFQSLADFIRGNYFYETFLLSELPMFNSNKINLIISKNMDKNGQRRMHLTDYLNDRKFFIEKINTLFTKSEMAVNDITFNEKKYFEQAVAIISESLGDLLNNEIVIWQDSWNNITNSDMNVEIMDINLASDSLLNYDAFEFFNKDLIFESSKYMATVILNSFRAMDNCAELLLNFFSEKPNFFLDKNSALYQTAENEISKSLLEILSTYFDEYLEKCNILLPLIYYDILATIHDKISKNLMDDIIFISLDDIIDQKSLNEEGTAAHHNNHNPHLNLTQRSNNNNNNNYENQHYLETNNTRKFNFGFDDHSIGSRISLQVTKSFIKLNLKTMSVSLLKFFNMQKEDIDNFTCKPRRVGIIPIIKKGCNFLKLIISLTCQIKQDYIYQQTEEFIVKMKICIEKISKIDPKYTNIILLENYYYIHKFLKSFDYLNITNTKILELEKYCFTVFEKFKNIYIEEVFSYQFREFWDFYSKLIFEFEQQGDKIKTQASFIFNNFNKKTQTFLKDLPKNIERMAGRVHKHFCKEEGLSPFIFTDLQNFLQKIIKTIDRFYDVCYKSASPAELVKNALEAVIKFNFSKFNK